MVDKIRNWTYSMKLRRIANDLKTDEDKQFTYKGFELLFNERDAGSYGMYKCATNLYDEGEPFSILVEGIEPR